MRSIVIVVSVLALAAGCASNSAPAAKRHTKPEENAMLNSDDALSSEAYAAKVAEAGGRVDSTDYGKTWGEVYRTALPNNNSGLDVLMLDDGRLLLVFNPVPMNWGPRTPLDLAVSTDNGHTWRVIAHLEDDPDKDSEYSYPAIVETDGGVAVTYTWQRQRVRCWQIPLDALE